MRHSAKQAWYKLRPCQMPRIDDGNYWLGDTLRRRVAHLGPCWHLFALVIVVAPPLCSPIRMNESYHVKRNFLND